MVSGINYSSMHEWISSSAIQDLATAFRTDSASVADATEHIGPAWRDLRAFMMIGVTGNDPFFYAGDDVSRYGEAVETGGDNIAKYMEECVQTLQGLESQRTAIIDRADRVNSWVASHPPSVQMQMVTEVLGQEPPWSEIREVEKYQDEQDEIVAEMATANRHYADALDDMAEKVRSLDDDGSTANTWLGPLIDVLILTGSVVGIFVPPVGVAATGAEISKNYYDSYHEHQRKLLEEHPEMYDWDITEESLKMAVIQGTPDAVMSMVLGKLDPRILRDLELGKPLEEWQKNAIKEAVDRVMGIFLDRVPDPDLSGPEDPNPPRYPGDQGASQTTSAQEQATQDAQEATKIKDYDGDGYTDEPFLPGSQEVIMGEVEVAEEVKIDWTGPLDPDKPKNNPVPPPRLPATEPTTGSANPGSASPSATNQPTGDPDEPKPRKPVVASKTPLIRS